MVSPIPKMTLYTWPEGLFPRRTQLYLLAKHVPSEILSTHLTQVSYTASPSGFVPTSPLPVGMAPKPPGSLPCLVVHTPGKPDTVIHESISILGFWEEIFAGHGRDMWGETALERAHANDLLRVVEETILWTMVYGRHARPSSSLWSGLPNEKRNKEAGLDGRAQLEKHLEKLQIWAFGDVSEGEDGWLAGGPLPGVVDVSLGAFVVYMRQMYCHDVVEGYKRLEAWMERYERSEWCTLEPLVPEATRVGDDREF